MSRGHFLRLAGYSAAAILSASIIGMVPFAIGHFMKKDESYLPPVAAYSGSEIDNSSKYIVRERSASAQPVIPVRPGCILPPASDDVKLVLVGAYEGTSVSSVALGNQDEVTDVATIAIAGGDKPYYLVVASQDAMVWRFDADPSRIERVVVLAPPANRNSGVTGIGADKVIFTDPVDDCFPHFHEQVSDEAALAADAIEQMAGRRPDFLAGIYAIHKLKLPEFTFVDPRKETIQPPSGADQKAWDSAIHFAPGGLVTFNLEEVLSPAPVVEYEVLPQEFGILQLLEGGYLEAVERDKSKPIQPERYRIVKPFSRFPAGLTGAHSVSFILSPGIPMPGGSAGHSCVEIEGDGQPSELDGPPPPHCYY